MTTSLTTMAFDIGIAAHRNLGLFLNVLTAFVVVAQGAGVVRWRAIGDALAYCAVLSASAALVSTAPWVARSGSWCSNEAACIAYAVNDAWPLALAWAGLGVGPLRNLIWGNSSWASNRSQRFPQRKRLRIALALAVLTCTVTAVLSLSIGLGTLIAMMDDSLERGARLALEAAQRDRGMVSVFTALASWGVSVCLWIGILVAQYDKTSPKRMPGTPTDSL